MSPQRYLTIKDKIGSYQSGAPVTLRSIYGNKTPQELRAALVEDFNLDDLIPPVPANGIYGRFFYPQHPQAIPLYKKTLRVCVDQDIANGLGVPNDHFYKKIRCVDLDDTLDWLVIQVALFRSIEVGKSFTLDLPKQSGSYAINQVLGLLSNAHLRWVPNGLGEYSYMQMVGEGAFGTMTGGGNPYSLYYVNFSPEVISNTWFDNPRLDGGGVEGENGISFGRGSKNTKITGGEIRNIVGSFAKQGGRAIQCEQGCENLVIDGLSLNNVTIGISSAVSQAQQSSIIADPNMTQSTMNITNIKMNNVDAPFVLSNTKTDAQTYPDRQMVLIDGVQMTNSGAFRLTNFANTKPDRYFSVVSTTTGQRAWCYDKAKIEKFYQLNSFYGPQDSGIFYLDAPRNITIRNVDIKNDASYPKIGGVFRGEKGTNISVSNVKFSGKAKAVVNFAAGITGLGSIGAKLKDVTIDKMVAQGTFDYNTLSATDIPLVYIKNGACAVDATPGRFENIVITNSSANSKVITKNTTPN
jgi:hypothetical protein